MLAGMVWAMTGGHGPARALPAAAGLIGLSLALAPLLRRRAAVRDHVLDLWAMAGLLLVPVLAGASTRPAAVAAMPGMPGMGPLALAAVPLAVAVGLGWAGLRAWSMHVHARSRVAGAGDGDGIAGRAGSAASLRECAITAGITGAGLLAMAVL